LQVAHTDESLNNEELYLRKGGNNLLQNYFATQCKSFYSCQNVGQQ
jgi:hypothetical protein